MIILCGVTMRGLSSLMHVPLSLMQLSCHNHNKGRLATATHLNRFVRPARKPRTTVGDMFRLGLQAFGFIHNNKI